MRKLNFPGHATVPITFWDIPGEDELDFYESFFRDLDAVIGKLYQNWVGAWWTV